MNWDQSHVIKWLQRLEKWKVAAAAFCGSSLYVMDRGETECVFMFPWVLIRSVDWPWNLSSACSWQQRSSSSDQLFWPTVQMCLVQLHRDRMWLPSVRILYVMDNAEEQKTWLLKPRISIYVSCSHLINNISMRSRWMKQYYCQRRSYICHKSLN